MEYVGEYGRMAPAPFLWVGAGAQQIRGLKIWRQRHHRVNVLIIGTGPFIGTLQL